MSKHYHITYGLDEFDYNLLRKLALRQDFKLNIEIYPNHDEIFTDEDMGYALKRLISNALHVIKSNQ